jgi:hypothetical protein
MLVSSWLIEGPEGQQIEVVQLDMGRADSVSFAWRENRRPIYPDAPHVLRRLSHRAVFEYLLPGEHFAVISNWVTDPSHELDGLARTVLQFVDALDEEELLAICRRNARHRLDCDEQPTFK